jgi:GT2 family glycosyltransferase
MDDDRASADLRLSTRLASLNSSLIDWRRLERELPNRTQQLTSVIVLVYNNIEFTRGCIKSICANADPATLEILLVDNGSDDAIFDQLYRLTQENKNVRLVPNPENYMFALGNNIGCAFSSGEYLVILNNDTEVIKDGLQLLVTTLEEDAAVGVVGPKLLYGDNTLQCGGIVFSDLSKIPYHIYRGFQRGAVAINKRRSFQAVTGACFAVRAEDYIRLRGFDPTFINGCEDLDFCFRMKRGLGKEIIYNPDSEFYHFESKTLGRGKYIQFNRKLFVSRWRDHVVADDRSYFAEDGFKIQAYEKPGKEPDGETASYVPILIGRTAPCTAGAVSNIERTFNIGFVSIWHARGISFHTLQLARAFEEGPFMTHICARWESHKFQNCGVINHPRVWNGGDDPTEAEIVAWARERHIDLVIFMEVHPKDWKRVSALREAGVLVVCYENLDILRQELWDKYGVFEFFLFNAFRAREIMLEKFPNARHLMVPWGIPPEFTKNRRPGMGSSQLVNFVHVAGWGGLNNRKNTDLLIKAFDESGAANALLHIYSQVPIAAYGTECTAIVSRNKSIRGQAECN